MNTLNFFLIGYCFYGLIVTIILLIREAFKLHHIIHWWRYRNPACRTCLICNEHQQEFYTPGVLDSNHWVKMS